MISLISKCILSVLELDYEEHKSFVLRSADGVKNKEYVFHFGNTYDMIILLQKAFLEPQCKACTKEKKLRKSVSDLHMKFWHEWICNPFESEEEYQACKKELSDLKESLSLYMNSNKKQKTSHS